MSQKERYLAGVGTERRQSQKLDITYTALVTRARNISRTDDLFMRTSGKVKSTCIPNLTYQYIPTGNRNPGQTMKNSRITLELLTSQCPQ
jgi:hypothetical protein